MQVLPRVVPCRISQHSFDGAFSLLILDTAVLLDSPQVTTLATPCSGSTTTWRSFCPGPPARLERPEHPRCGSFRHGSPTATAAWGASLEEGRLSPTYSASSSGASSSGASTPALTELMGLLPSSSGQSVGRISSGCSSGVVTRQSSGLTDGSGSSRPSYVPTPISNLCPTSGASTPASEAARLRKFHRRLVE